jgi:hypothetical protein
VDGAKDLTVTTTTGGAFSGAIKRGGAVGGMTSLGIVSLTADSITISASLKSGTAILQPFTPNLTIDLGGTDKSGATLGLGATELNNITAGVLRIGSAADTGNITVRDNIILGKLDGTDNRTLSLLTSTASGTISQLPGARIEVAQLALEAAKVDLNPPNPTCNNVNVLAAHVTSSLSYKDADSTLTFADGIGGHPANVDGIVWNPPQPPGGSLSVTENCGTIQVASLNQDLASISYVNIPIPRLSLSEIELGGNIDTAEVKNRFGNNSIITFYLEVPFPKKRFNLSRLKLEEQSKWVGGHLAIFGATSGPQGSQ